MPNTLVLIDGQAHLYRAFYAIRGLTDPKGRPVNAVFGFAQMILNLLSKIHPSHVVVAFDTPLPTHRHVRYPDYKATRQAMPEELRPQVALIKDLLKAFGIAILEKPGLEADDILGTLADAGRKQDLEVLIFTTDKDAFQLVQPGVFILRPVRGGKGEFERLDEAGVEAAFGVSPERVVDVLALAGDASDNVPGVPGIGEKTALGLIRNFGSLDKIYDHLNAIPQAKLREKLLAHRRDAELSRELVTIERCASLDFSLEQALLPPEPLAAAFELLQALGFKNLSIQKQQPAAAAAPAVDGWSQGINVQAEVSVVLAAARRSGWLGIECLPEGLALAGESRSAALIPYVPGGLLPTLRQGGEWITILNDAAISKISFDLKPLVTGLLRAGRAFAGPYEDLHLAAHLLDLPAQRQDDFLSRTLGAPAPEDRAAARANATLILGKTFLGRLAEAGAEPIYRDLELPLLPVLARMEAVGVALDKEALLDMSIRLGLQLHNMEQDIQTMAGVEFNLRSPQQLAEVLFDRLQLQPGRKTKTGRSTDVDVLETLAADHPLPGKILEYRQLQKLKSTYLDVLPDLVDPVDGRLHTTYHQVGAATGRLSSSDPNLQNIPIRTDLGRELRRAFVPGRPGWAMLSADYSQIELRLLAHLAQDKRMLDDFASGLDIHRATAAELFNVAVDAVSPEMRRQAKVCNFGIAYGISPFGLARQLGISQRRGQEFIDRFYSRYPGVRRYLDGVIAAARRDGYVATILGRRRSVPDIRSENRTIRDAAERAAINTPIQGSAADLIKRAMVRLDAALTEKKFETRMLLQVHDELVFEGPQGEMEKLREQVVGIMEAVYPMDVRLAVEAAWGKNWMEAHP